MPKVSCCPFRLHVYTFLVSGGWKQIFLAIVFCRDPSSSFFSEIFRYSYSYASLRPPEESVAVIVVTWKIFILSIFKKKNFVLGLIIDFNIFRFSFLKNSISDTQVKGSTKQRNSVSRQDHVTE